MKQFLFAIFLMACGAGWADSPIHYDVTCYQQGGFYWVGLYNLDDDTAKLHLDWGNVHDEADLRKMPGTARNFEGYGKKFLGKIPRHFQVVFSHNYSSVAIHFEERGYWVQKATLLCERN